MKRVWKPLDLNGLRLYRVNLWFPGKTHWNEDKIVAAKSPTDAADIVTQQNLAAEVVWQVEPTIKGYALDVCYPEAWRDAPDARHFAARYAGLVSRIKRAAPKVCDRCRWDSPPSWDMSHRHWLHGVTGDRRRHHRPVGAVRSRALVGHSRRNWKPAMHRRTDSLVACLMLSAFAGVNLSPLRGGTNVNRGGNYQPCGTRRRRGLTSAAKRRGKARNKG